MPQFPLENDNKENYNPEIKMYSPTKLVNQKRYKILKELVLKNRSSGDVSKSQVLREKVLDEPVEEGEGCDYKPLEFVDESTRTYGL